MPPLEDAEIRAKLCEAFRYRTSEGVVWKRTASEWILKNLESSPDCLDGEEDGARGDHCKHPFGTMNA
jgi:hypothetical protein